MGKSTLVWVLLGAAALIAIYFYFKPTTTAAGATVNPGFTPATLSGGNGGTPVVSNVASLVSSFAKLFSGGGSSQVPAQTTPTASALQAYLSPQAGGSYSSVAGTPELAASAYSTVTPSDLASGDQSYLYI